MISQLDTDNFFSSDKDEGDDQSMFAKDQNPIDLNCFLKKDQNQVDFSEAKIVPYSNLFFDAEPIDQGLHSTDDSDNTYNSSCYNNNDLFNQNMETNKTICQEEIVYEMNPSDDESEDTPTRCIIVASKKITKLRNPKEIVLDKDQKTKSQDKKNHPGLLRGRTLKAIRECKEYEVKKEGIPARLVYLSSYLKSLSKTQYESLNNLLEYYSDNENKGDMIKNEKTWASLKRFCDLEGGDIFKVCMTKFLNGEGEEDLQDWIDSFGGSDEGRNYIESEELFLDFEKNMNGEGSKKGKTLTKKPKAKVSNKKICKNL
jgi:hypothetical protein